MTSPSPRGTATPLDLRKLEPNGKALDLEVFAHPAVEVTMEEREREELIQELWLAVAASGFRATDVRQMEEVGTRFRAILERHFRLRGRGEGR